MARKTTGGALAGKYNLLYCLGQDPAAERNVDTSRFWVIFENSQDCRQIIGLSRRSIFHAPKFSQMPHTAKIKKMNDFTNKIKNPLELRLGKDCLHPCAGAEPGPCPRLGAPDLGLGPGSGPRPMKSVAKSFHLYPCPQQIFVFSVTLTRNLFATWVEAPGFIFLVSYFRFQISYVIFQI